VAWLALFVALGGAASGLAGRNTVDSGDVVDQSLRSRDIGEGAVRASEVRNGALGQADIGTDAIGASELLDGSITPAKLGVVPAARVEAPQEDPGCATQSIPSGNSEIVRWSVEAFDTQGLHIDPPAGCTAGTQSRLTVPIDGIYLVSAGLVWPSDPDGRRQLEVLVNGAAEAVGDSRPAVTGVGTVENVSTALRLSAGDYVETRAFQNSGGSLALEDFGETYLAGIWLGP
jgi:hypothetical protein